MNDEIKSALFTPYKQYSYRFQARTLNSKHCHDNGLSTGLAYTYKNPSTHEVILTSQTCNDKRK